MRSKHSKLAEVFSSNGVRRCDVEAVIQAVVSNSLGKPIFVKSFVLAGEFLGCAATPDQYAAVARQMADDGLLWATTIGGNYAYSWWADNVR